MSITEICQRAPGPRGENNSRQSPCKLGPKQGLGMTAVPLRGQSKDKPRNHPMAPAALDLPNPPSSRELAAQQLTERVTLRTPRRRHPHPRATWPLPRRRSLSAKRNAIRGHRTATAASFVSLVPTILHPPLPPPLTNTTFHNQSPIKSSPLVTTYAAPASAAATATTITKEATDTAHAML